MFSCFFPRPLTDQAFCQINFEQITTKVPAKASYPHAGNRELAFYRHPVNWSEYWAMRHASKTAFLGNFYPCSIKVSLDGRERTFQNAEAAFQAAKFSGDSNLIDLFTRYTGAKAAREAKKLEDRQDVDWQSRSISWMKELLNAKFRQNLGLQQALINTASLQLTERTPKTGRDTFYATDPDGTGLNKLGESLMAVRASLIQENPGKVPSTSIDGDQTQKWCFMRCLSRIWNWICRFFGWA